MGRYINHQLCESISKERLLALHPDGYVFEPKLDGIRVEVYKTVETVYIWGRRGEDITNRFPELAEALKEALPDDTIVEGEIVMPLKGEPDRGGWCRHSFNDLLPRVNLTDKFKVGLAASMSPARFYIFDVYNDAGYFTRDERTDTRRTLLQSSNYKYNDRVQLIMRSDRETVLKLVETEHLEGVVAKSKISEYQPGERTWMKWKDRKSEDCIVIGYTGGEGERAAYFGALVLAQYDRDANKMRYVGKVGSGFTTDDVIGITNYLGYDAAGHVTFDEYGRRAVTAGPFVDAPYGDMYPDDIPFKYVALSPRLMATVEFQEKSHDGIFRQPTMVDWGEVLDGQLHNIRYIPSSDSPDEKEAVAAFTCPACGKFHGETQSCPR